MRAILIAALTILTSSAMAEPAVTKIDTELSKGRCRFIKDDGEVGDYAMKRCPGVAGWRVYTEAEVRTVALQFRKGSGKIIEVTRNDTLGTKLEWRGTGNKTGFTPHAAIVTLVVKEYSKQADHLADHNMLGVLRVEPRNVCLVAIVDEKANPDALALARATADKDAATIGCTKDLKPKIVGAETQWAREAIGVEPDLRKQ